MKRTLAFLSLMLVFTVVAFGQTARLKTACCDGSCCPTGCTSCCQDGSCGSCCLGK